MKYCDNILVGSRFVFEGALQNGGGSPGMPNIVVREQF